jgi:precorrin-6A/cobalt-precorrin-6A reductase
MVDRVPLLILGGTREARELAEILDGDGRYDVVTSLAGRTLVPLRPPGRLRVGGFGGAAGMAEYLRGERISLVVDATHPFASRISANTARACAEIRIPHFILSRPPWEAQSGDRWTPVASPGEAAACLAALGERVFLSVGRKDLASFGECRGVWFLLRTVDPLGGEVPLGAYEAIVGRGPFPQEDERALLERYRIDLVVSRNSGGGATGAKLAAARALGLPAILIQRPPLPAGDVVSGVDEALGRIEAALRRLRR